MAPSKQMSARDRSLQLLHDIKLASFGVSPQANFRANHAGEPGDMKKPTSKVPAQVTIESHFRTTANGGFESVRAIQQGKDYYVEGVYRAPPRMKRSRKAAEEEEEEEDEDEIEIEETAPTKKTKTSSSSAYRSSSASTAGSSSTTGPLTRRQREQRACSMDSLSGHLDHLDVKSESDVSFDDASSGNAAAGPSRLRRATRGGSRLTVMDEDDE